METFNRVNEELGWSTSPVDSDSEIMKGFQRGKRGNKEDLDERYYSRVLSLSCDIIGMDRISDYIQISNIIFGFDIYKF